MAAAGDGKGRESHSVVRDARRRNAVGAGPGRHQEFPSDVVAEVWAAVGSSSLVLLGGPAAVTQQRPSAAPSDVPRALEERRFSDPVSKTFPNFRILGL